MADKPEDLDYQHYHQNTPQQPPQEKSYGWAILLIIIAVIAALVWVFIRFNHNRDVEKTPVEQINQSPESGPGKTP